MPPEHRARKHHQDRVAETLREEIGAMMKDLDVPSDRDQSVYVFHMDNADPQQAVQVPRSRWSIL